ncbi:MAG: hypothetical protein ACREXY_18245, partial [Gammaproteobacteria bacterium]
SIPIGRVASVGPMPAGRSAARILRCPASHPHMAAPVILREKVRPILAGVNKPRMGRKPKPWSPIDEHYEAIRRDMFTLMEDLRIAA